MLVNGALYLRNELNNDGPYRDDLNVGCWRKAPYGSTLNSTGRS
jgi:hypothetical protein